MTALYKVGTFVGSGSTGDQAITGVGFQPIGIILWTPRTATGGSNPGDGKVTIGAATSSTARWSSGFLSEDAEGTSDCRTSQVTDELINFPGATTDTESDVLELKTLDSDGFTVTFGAASSVRYHYIAFGGTVTMKVGTLTIPSSGATLAVTGVGFEPDLVLFVGGILNTTEGVRAGINFGVGAAVSSTNRFASCIYEQDAAADTVCKQSLSLTQCFRQTDSSSVLCAADLASMDSDGFTLDIETNPAANTQVCYVALGGVRATTGAIDAPETATTQAYTGVGFEPELLMLLGSTNAATNGTIQAEIRFDFGAADGTTQGQGGASMDDNVSVSGARNNLSTSGIWKQYDGTSGSIEVNGDLSSFDSDGFTIDFSAGSDPGSRNKGYIAFAQPLAGGGGAVYGGSVHQLRRRRRWHPL